MLFFISYISYIIYEMRQNRFVQGNNFAEMSFHKAFVFVLLGIVGLYFGGRWVVDGAIAFARTVGLSEYIISATIVAVGTSLPELITSIIGIMKKESDISLGNVIGSNIFNVFFVLGMSSVIAPIEISSIFDIFLNLFVSVFLFVFMFFLYRVNDERKSSIGKWQGAIFLSFYVFYIVSLIFRA